MTTLEWIGLGVAAIAGAFTALARVYKFGPFLDNEEMPSLDREPEDVPFVPASVPPVIAPKQPVIESITESTPKPTLEQFALAIRDFEGKPGDQNYRLNNPGNCRYNPSGYLPMYGVVGKSKNGFAHFTSYEIGWKYLINMLRGQIHKRPNQSILEFMQRYAPVEDDNNPVIYSNFIAKRLSVDNSYKVGLLV